MTKKTLERLVVATWYEEKYGITSSRINGNELIYYTSYPTEHRTYKVIFNLDTAIEERHVMSKYYKPSGKIGNCRVLCCI